MNGLRVAFSIYIIDLWKVTKSAWAMYNRVVVTFTPKFDIGGSFSYLAI